MDDDGFDRISPFRTIKVRKNGSRREPKELQISNSWMSETLLRAVSAALSLKVKRLFHADGVEIDDPNMIDDGECIYASSGDDFIAPIARKSSFERAGETVIVGYRVTRVLGKGGFGVVKLGQHLLTGEFAAMKFLSKHAFAQTKAVDRVITEISCLVDLDHPHIIRLKGVHDTPECMVIALEYAPGGDLGDFLNLGGCLEEEPAKTKFLQVLRGVQYAHNRGIVHRDLKLENILIAADGRCLVSDFGLSQYAPREGMTVATGGSLFYLTPESFSSSRTSGQAVDVWCMGIMLYLLLVGRYPFFSPTLEAKMNDIAGKPAGAVYNKQLFTKACALVDRATVIKEARNSICKDGACVPSMLSLEAQDLLTRMLDKDPDTRITIAQILVHPWVFSHPMFPSPTSPMMPLSPKAPAEIPELLPPCKLDALIPDVDITTAATGTEKSEAISAISRKRLSTAAPATLFGGFSKTIRIAKVQSYSSIASNSADEVARGRAESGTYSPGEYASPLTSPDRLPILKTSSGRRLQPDRMRGVISIEKSEFSGELDRAATPSTPNLRVTLRSRSPAGRSEGGSMEYGRDKSASDAQSSPIASAVRTSPAHARFSWAAFTQLPHSPRESLPPIISAAVPAGDQPQPRLLIQPVVNKAARLACISPRESRSLFASSPPLSPKATA